MDDSLSNFAWPLLAAVLVLTLLQSLRVSVTGRLVAEKPNVLTHHFWLYPLGVLGPFIIGMFTRGVLSPWAPDAYAKIEASSGMWAGAAAFLAVVIVEIWMFWAAAKAMMATRLTSSVFRPMHKEVAPYYHIVNLLVGVFILYKVWDTAP